MSYSNVELYLQVRVAAGRAGIAAREAGADVAQAKHGDEAEPVLS